MATVAIKPEVLEVLNRSDISDKVLKLPDEQLDRKVYLDVAKTIKLAGGKWNTKAQGFLFDKDPREKLGMALKKGAIVDDKKRRQAFYTPAAVAAELAEHADVTGFTGLEPSAGSGSLLRACLEYAPQSMDCIELEEECREELEFLADRVTIGDFLKMQPPAKGYDRVVMNPPFSKGQDVKHVTHAAKWLNPGGYIVAIVPDKPHPKLEALGAEDILSFGPGAFKESGTGISTKLIRLRRAQ